MPSDIAIQSHKATRLAADVGGTFTDVAAFDERTGELKLGKTLTTPQRLVNGMVTGWKRPALPSAMRGFSCTAPRPRSTPSWSATAPGPACLLRAASAISTRSAGSTGPKRTIFIFRKHQPLVERHLRREVNERVTFAGEVLQPLDPAEIVRLAGELVADGCEAIAVLFLHSYRSPAHEAEAKRVIQASFPDCS